METVEISEKIKCSKKKDGMYVAEREGGMLGQCSGKLASE